MPTNNMMFRPEFYLPGLAAFAQASQDPYRNPILDFALAGRQGFEQFQLAEEERLRREAEEERRRQAEEQKQALLMLELGQLGTDPTNRDLIRLALGPDAVRHLEPAWFEADRAADETEWSRVSELQAAEDARSADRAALAAAIPGLSGGAGGGAEALLAAGQVQDVADLIEADARAKSQASLRGAPAPVKPQLRSGNTPLISVDPMTGTVETIYNPPAKAEKGKSREDLALQFLQDDLREAERVGRKTDMETLVRQAYDKADAFLSGGRSDARVSSLSQEVESRIEALITAGVNPAAIRSELIARGEPAAAVDATIARYSSSSGGTGF